MPKTLSLTLQDDEPIPTAGETRLFRGLAGWYAVTIHRVQRVESLANQSLRITVTATRHLVQFADPALLVTGTEEIQPQQSSCSTTERNDPNGC